MLRSYSQIIKPTWLMTMTTTKNYRPLLHFTPAFGWLNDPNGLVWHQGQFHLFYQYYPLDNVWGPMHWGHATSRDLMHWQHWPIALAPDENGYCFSGSAVIDHQNRSGLFSHKQGLLAWYTHATTPRYEGGDFVQSQGLAYSDDGGHHWQKYAGNPILPDTGRDDFRDPKVFWYEPKQYWVMVVTGGQHVMFYRSENGTDWTWLSDFGAEHGAHDERAWECPDLFELKTPDGGSRWVLVVGVQRQAYAGGSGTQYFIGQFDGVQFINDNLPEQVLWLDYGRDFYATQTWSDVPEADGRRIGLSWMSCWPYANQTPTQHWRSCMSFPREFNIVETQNGLRLQQAFVREWHRAICRQGTIQNIEIAPTQTLALTDWRHAMHLALSFSFADNTVATLEVVQGIRFEFIRQDQSTTLRVVRHQPHHAIEFVKKFDADYGVDLGDVSTVQLQLLLDISTVELLLNDGTVSVSLLSFPTDVPMHAVSLTLNKGQILDCEGEWSELTSHP